MEKQEIQEKLGTPMNRWLYQNLQLSNKSPYDCMKSIENLTGTSFLSCGTWLLAFTSASALQSTLSFSLQCASVSMMALSGAVGIWSLQMRKVMDDIVMRPIREEA